MNIYDGTDAALDPEAIFVLLIHIRNISST